MNVISKSKSTIGSSNLVKDGTIYRTSDLYDNTKRFANFNYNYTDKSELRRIRSTNTELKKVIKQCIHLKSVKDEVDLNYYEYFIYERFFYPTRNHLSKRFQKYLHEFLSKL